MGKSFEQVRDTLQPEFKSLPMHTKAIEGRTVTTLFSVFGNVDDYADRIWPGAFAVTFAQRSNKVLHLWQHDFMSPPIAVVKALREVKREQLPQEVLDEYPEAQGGAEADSEFLDDERSDAVFKALKAGSPLQASFGYDPIRFDFSQEGDTQVRNLREVRIWELSTVLWGANSATLGSKALLPLDFLIAQMQLRIKSGARHSAADIKLINQLHALVADLGATNCKGVVDESEAAEDGEKSRAANDVALTQLRQKLALLDLSIAAGM